MRRLINLNSKHIQWIYEFSKRWVDPIAIPWTKKNLLVLFERCKNAPHLIIKGTECYCTATKKQQNFSISPCLVFVPSFVLLYFCFLMLPVQFISLFYLCSILFLFVCLFFSGSVLFVCFWKPLTPRLDLLEANL